MRPSDSSPTSRRWGPGAAVASSGPTTTVPSRAYSRGVVASLAGGLVKIDAWGSWP